MLFFRNYIRERFKKEEEKLTTTGNMGQYIVFAFLHIFQNFLCTLGGKKGKMLVFTGVYVCVKAKLTLVRFFSFFFLHLSLTQLHCTEELSTNKKVLGTCFIV